MEHFLGKNHPKKSINFGKKKHPKTLPDKNHYKVNKIKGIGHFCGCIFKGIFLLKKLHPKLHPKTNKKIQNYEVNFQDEKAKFKNEKRVKND